MRVTMLQIKKGKLGSAHQSNQSCVRKGMCDWLSGTWDQFRNSRMNFEATHHWVLVKCVCAFVSFKLFFSDNFGSVLDC